MPEVFCKLGNLIGAVTLAVTGMRYTIMFLLRPKLFLFYNIALVFMVEISLLCEEFCLAC